ncbi:MAG: GGDEF domain-containing protein [Alteraurantiacibacter sp.]
MRDTIIGMVTPTMAIVFAMVFAAIWLRGIVGRHALAFAVSYLLLACGLLIVHLNVLPSAIIFHTVHLIYSMATVLLISGLTQRINAPLNLFALGLCYATALVGLTGVVALTDSVGPKLVMTNMGYGAMFVIAAVTLGNSPRRGFVDKVVVVMLIVNAADFFVRPTLTTMTEDPFLIVDYRDSIYFSIINLALAMKALTTAIVLVGVCLVDMLHGMREATDRDPMTGLRNRRAFEDEVDRQLARAESCGVPMAVVVADIDHFKQVNDIWGHQAGDVAIANFGKLIDTMVREHDTCGRIGGEEFCITVWDCPEDAAARLAERIRTRFAQMAHDGLGDDIRLSASFGVAAWRSGESYHRVFARADAALYRAKDKGRNRVEQVDDVPITVERRAAIAPSKARAAA